MLDSVDRELEICPNETVEFDCRARSGFRPSFRWYYEGNKTTNPPVSTACTYVGGDESRNTGSAECSACMYAILSDGLKEKRYAQMVS